MERSTLVETGTYAFRRLGKVRGSQYQCNGECMVKFTIPKVHCELEKREQLKFVNALGQAWRRNCKCQGEKSEEGEIEEQIEKRVPSWNPLTARPDRWSEERVIEHLDWHGEDHKLGTLHHLKREVDSYFVVFESLPTGLLCRELMLPLHVLRRIESLEPLLKVVDEDYAIRATLDRIITDIERRNAYRLKGPLALKRENQFKIDEEWKHPFVFGRRKSWARLTAKEKALSKMSGELREAQRVAEERACEAAEARSKFENAQTRMKELKAKLEELHVDSDKWIEAK